MRTTRWFLSVRMIAMALLLLVSRQVAGSDESPAEDVLKEKQLRKSGVTWVVAEEAKLSQMMTQATKLKRQVSDAGKSLEAAARVADEKKRVLAQLKLQHVNLSARLANVRNVEENNRLVGQLNAIAGQIDLALQDQTVEESLRQTRSKTAEIREEYAQMIIDMRKLHDSIQAQYQVLGADAAVKVALEQLSQNSEKAMVLGPSRGLAGIDRQLQKLEDTVLSEDIAARRGNGDLLYVTAVFNGEDTIEIAVDTGASSVVLPWQMADKMGMKPGPDAQRAVFVMADGRQSEGWIVRAKSVRVGKFTVEDVECAVLGPENTNAEPLLGQSFLGNFVYRIDAGRETISMIGVEQAAAARPAGSRRSKSKSP